MSACSRTESSCSAGISCGSVIPWNGTTCQAFFPSKPDDAVFPWKLKSMRTESGRIISVVIGASAPGPRTILPVMRIERTALSFARPPMASR